MIIFEPFTLIIREKTVANCALLRCKTFSLKIWVCKIFDKFHVCHYTLIFLSGRSELVEFKVGVRAYTKDSVAQEV